MSKDYAVIENYISTAIKNLTKANNLKDSELILACLVNLRETVDSYIEILERGVKI
jgi:hypothetical protein